MPRRVHPPGDEKAAYQYEQYLKANDPHYGESNRDICPIGPDDWHENLLAPEPDFPVEVLEDQNA